MVGGAEVPTNGDRPAPDGDPRGDGAGSRLRILLGVVATVLAVDIVTKWIVQRTFRLGQSVEVVGDVFRLTFIMNPGAAFGLHLGPHSRIIFLLLALVALGILVVMYWTTPREDRFRLYAIALVCGGAIGNLIDRVRSARGVVDFLDFGIGDVRWPIFNVADIAVTVGAALLAISLWFEEQRDARPESGE